MSSTSPVKQTLSVVVIGTENAGKSVALKHLLHKTGHFPAALIARFEQEALKQMGGGIKKVDNADPTHHAQFKFEWIVEKMAEEKAREGGAAALDIQVLRFDTEKYGVHVLDVPGHKDFMKNMITGTSQAHVALLFVSAVPEELQHGFSAEGQTKEHAMLAFTLGLHQLIVAINKMDRVQWSQEAFQEATQETSLVLKKIGYNVRNIPFVPISGAQGENLTQPSAHLDWFKGWKKIGKSGEKSGITLISAIDAMELPKRLPDLPLRITVQDVYQIKSDIVPVGRVESGVLQPGIEVQVAPSLARGTVVTVEMGSAEPTKAYPGDKAGFAVQGLQMRDIKRGCVCSEAGRDPALPAHAFIASVVAMDRCTRLVRGDKVVLDVHNARAECTVTELMERVDRRNGQVLEEGPKALKAGEAAVIKLTPAVPVCVEAFSEYPALGRIALRDQRQTLAVGIVKMVEKKDAEGKIIVCPRKR